MLDWRLRVITQERARSSSTAIASLHFSRPKTTFELSIHDTARYISDRFLRRRWKPSNPPNGPSKRIPPTIKSSGLPRLRVKLRARASRGRMNQGEGNYEP